MNGFLLGDVGGNLVVFQRGRIGLVVVLDLAESELKAKFPDLKICPYIADIKNKSALFENVSFAAGYCMLDRVQDVREAMAEADARMYEDKENCYRTNPNLKRR